MIDMLSAQQVADLLECDLVTVGQRALAGDLPGLKVGRSWVFPAAALGQRLNELALDEADKRRAKRALAPPAAQSAPAPAPASGDAATARGRRRTAPVALPRL